MERDSISKLTLLRFADLRDRGVARNWPQLKHIIERDGFPPGRMISSNRRAWTLEEVLRWVESRPVVGPAPQGAAKARRGRPRKIVPRENHPE
jgi:hypothetical protein